MSTWRSRADELGWPRRCRAAPAFTRDASVCRGERAFAPAVLRGVGLFVGLLSCLGALAASAGRVPAPRGEAGGAPSGVVESWLAIELNGEAVSNAELVLGGEDGDVLVRGMEIERWRMAVADTAPRMHHGEAYYPLEALPGLEYRVDESSQTLRVEVPPSRFSLTELRGMPPATMLPATPPPGAFFNYDLHAERAQALETTSGLLEGGVFGAVGTAIASFAYRDVRTNDDRSGRFVRLRTTLTRDMPDKMASLRVGDAVTGAGRWGGAVRFGGVQWATNFDTRPDLATLPLPSMAGEAALPSTVDLYVNDVLRLRRDVPAGPFSVPDVPIVTGQGEVRMVVRDLLGREQVITQPYLSSPRLLRAGLHDYSYEIGFVRDNFGLASNDYGRLLAVGTHRMGLSEYLTGEIRGELLRDQQTAGLAGALLLRPVGVFGAAIAGSRSDAGSGHLVALDFERPSRILSFGASVQAASRNFVQAGLRTPRLVSRTFVSLATPGYGSLGVSHTRRRFDAGEGIELVTASYSVGLGGLGFLNLSASRVLGRDGDTLVGFSFTVPLGGSLSASAHVTSQGGRRQAIAQVLKSPPAGPGFGYRLVAGMGERAHQEAGLRWQNDVGSYELQAAHSESGEAVRASASGGLALLGGEAFLSRRIEGSFAVAQVADFPGVRIYYDNQLVGRTNAEGKLLLPRLRPYERNEVRIEQADLPLDVRIDSTEIRAVPYARSGLLLPFAVKRSKGAVLTILLENGAPLPAGGLVYVNEGGEGFPVGLHGRAYVTGLEPIDNRLRVSWHHQRCELTLPYVASDHPLPDLGQHVCRAVQP